MSTMNQSQDNDSKYEGPVVEADVAHAFTGRPARRPVLQGEESAPPHGRKAERTHGLWHGASVSQLRSRPLGRRAGERGASFTDGWPRRYRSSGSPSARMVCWPKSP